MLSKVLKGLIPAPHSGSGSAVPGASRTRDMLLNLEARYDNMKENERPHICYRFALHAGVAGNTISPVAEKRLNKTASYDQDYQKLMGIPTLPLLTQFDKQSIQESGILNFNGNGGTGTHLVHTAYLHRTAEGEFTLLHNNGAELDVEMLRGGTPLETRSRMNVYYLDNGNAAKLQRYISNGHAFYFTPASLLNQNAG